MNECATVASASADKYGFKYLIFRKCMNADLYTCVICCFMLIVWSCIIPKFLTDWLDVNRNISNLNSCIYYMFLNHSVSIN